MSTTNEKVKFESLLNATVKANNSNDTTRAYDVEASLSVSSGVLDSVNSGNVYALSNKQIVANFSKSMGMGLNIVFTSSASTDQEQCGILAAVNSFIADAKSKIESSPIVAVEN